MQPALTLEDAEPLVERDLCVSLWRALRSIYCSIGRYVLVTVMLTFTEHGYSLTITVEII